MADLARIKRNVASMASQGAPEEDIDGYITNEGVTLDDIKNFKLKPEEKSLFSIFTQDLKPANKEEQDQKKAEYNKQLGLTARYLVEGPTALPAMAANVLAAGSNKFLDTNFPEQGHAVSSALTQLGLPQPQTPGERIVGDISKGITSAATGVGVGRALIPAIQKGINSAIELISGAAGGGASGSTRELGGGPVAQMAAGALGAGGAVAAVPKAVNPNRISPLLEDVSEKGIDNIGAFTKVRQLLGNEAAKLQEEISGKFVNGQKVKPGLFDVAKEKGKNLFIDKESVTQLSNTFKQQAAEEIDDDSVKLLQNVGTRLDALSKKNDLNLNDIERLRRSASQVSNTPGSVGHTGKTITKQIDQWLDDSLASNAVQGDKTAISTWKEAISKRREFGKKFENPKEIAAAIAEEPNEVIEKMFLGFGPVSSKREIARIYKNTLKALPDNQKNGAGFLLRQSIVNKMIKNASRTVDAEEGVSGMRLADQIKDLRKENQSIWNKYPDNEKRDLLRLEGELRKNSEGGPINKIGEFLFKRLSYVTRSNLELPRTIKPKVIFTIKDLEDFTKIKPRFKTKRGAIGISTSIKGEDNEEY